MHAQALIGKKGVIPPKAEATEQEWADFYKAIGMPDADKFELKTPDGLKIDSKFLDGFKQMAIKGGMLPKKAQEMLGWYLGLEKNQQAERKAAQDKAAKEGFEGLQKKWGDAYSRELDRAEFAIRELSGDSDEGKKGAQALINQLTASGDAFTIEIFSKAAKLLGEDKLHEGGVGDGGSTVSEIQAELDEIRANGKDNGYFDKNHPNHKIINARAESLYKRLTKGK